MGTTTSQSKLLLNEICVSVVIVPQKGIEPPKSYLYAGDLHTTTLNIVRHEGIEPFVEPPCLFYNNCFTDNRRERIPL